MKGFARFLSARNLPVIYHLCVSFSAFLFGLVYFTNCWWVGLLCLVVATPIGIILTEVLAKYGKKGL